MGNIFHKDFRDFIKALNRCNVEYLVIGGYAVVLHGYSRNTGDLDFWVNKTAINYQKLKLAFAKFGMPVFDMTENNFLINPTLDVFTFGKPPVSIDILTKVKGLEYDKCSAKAVEMKVDGLKVRVIDFRDLINSKRESGRSKDLDDLENLQ
ncbi:MAG: nucleotidyltransferase [Bacteroidota bacterium]